MKNLIEITKDKFDVELDLRYATTNNVCGVKMYSYPFCYLHEEAAEKLQKAIGLAKNQGLRFKIFDGFRPIEVQKFMFEKFSVKEFTGFVSDPATGSTPHCRGVAVDLTLIDEKGNELEMGTGFDDFSKKAYHANCEISVEAQRNRFLLMGIMMSSGFDFYSQEWWHYQLFKPREFPIIEAKKEMVAI